MPFKIKILTPEGEPIKNRRIVVSVYKSHLALYRKGGYYEEQDSATNENGEVTIYATMKGFAMIMIERTSEQIKKLSREQRKKWKNHFYHVYMGNISCEDMEFRVIEDNRDDIGLIKTEVKKQKTQIKNAAKGDINTLQEVKL